MRGLFVCAIGALCPLLAVSEAVDPELAAVLQAGCVVPTTTVTVPDGSTAAEAEMIVAARAVKARDAEATAYARCVNAAAERMLADTSLPEDKRQAVQAAQGQLVDAAIVPVERIAADFNHQLRCFQTRGPEASPCAASFVLPPGSTPPKPISVSGNGESILNSCYPDSARREGTEGRLVIRVLVGQDGVVKSTRLPDGVVDWQRKAADCLARKMLFEPARLADGTPVAAIAKVPIEFYLASPGEDIERVTYASLSSTAEEIAQIHRSCYPADLLPAGPSGEALYRVHLSTRGRVTKLELLDSSGDPRLDEAGRCIVKAYKFEPARRDGRPLASKFAWKVKVRPPTP